MAPRFSIIPGRFVEDRRAGINHYRVLNALGRHTDGEGWCRVKQAKLGEACGLSREAVCRRLSDLEAWGYVEKHDEDGSGRAIWYRVVHDAPVKPRSSPGDKTDDRPRKARRERTAPDELGERAWASEGAQLPVTEPSQVGACNPSRTCDDTITPGVTPSHHTWCDDTPSQHMNDPSQRSLSTTLSPPSPSPPAVVPMQRGWGRVDWIEDLRAAGLPALVLDELLWPLVALGGLKPWKGDGASPADPRGPAVQVCADLQHDDVAVLTALKAKILQPAVAKYRLPPVSVIRDLAGAARREVAEERERARAAGELAEVAVLGPETARWRDLVGRLSSPAFVAAWFAGAGIAGLDRGTRFATVVTEHRPGTVEKFADSVARAAVRALLADSDWDVRFVRGRAVEAAPVVAPAPAPTAEAASPTDAAAGEAIADAATPSEIELKPGDPRWAAWLDFLVQREGAKFAKYRRNRWGFLAAADWPPDSATVEVMPTGLVLVPWGTPEHAAWLAAWRSEGDDGKVRAQAADVSKRTLSTKTRWPEIPGRTA